MAPCSDVAGEKTGRVPFEAPCSGIGSSWSRPGSASAEEFTPAAPACLRGGPFASAAPAPKAHGRGAFLPFFEISLKTTKPKPYPTDPQTIGDHLKKQRYELGQSRLQRWKKRWMNCGLHQYLPTEDLSGRGSYDCRQVVESYNACSES